jgi:DNA processing protein
MDENQLFYCLLLSLVPQVGDVHVSILLEHFQDPEAIFKAKRRELESLNGIGTVRANAIKGCNQQARVEKELNFIQKNGIKVLVKGSDVYPKKMQYFQDAPYILYYKGSVDVNYSKIVSIIGTRSPTSFGKDTVVELINDLHQLDVLVVSGLAYGVDTIVHKEALKKDLATIGVLGHGLDQIYPQANRGLAVEMLQQGGLITEFMSKTKPDKQNFPLRNRIVSGIADAIIVIESGEKGGSLITANMANAYNKDVFAFSGRSIDTLSIGCNELIKTQRAQLINNGKDFLRFMNWEIKPRKTTVFQSAIFPELNHEEKLILEQLSSNDTLSIDQISSVTGLKPSQASCYLLSLEMKGLIRALPGKFYATIYR